MPPIHQDRAAFVAVVAKHTCDGQLPFARRCRNPEPVATIAPEALTETLADQGEPGVPIVPVMVGEAGRTMELARALFERGVLASGIRPPTVPPGTSRIRATLMATMTDQQIDRAIAAFADAGRALGLIP